MHNTRFIPMTAISLATAVLAACGGSGPGVEGIEAQDLFASYSGTWVLDTLSSDQPPSRDVPVPADASFGGPARGGGQGRSGGVSRGVPGGGGRGGGRGGGALPGSGRGASTNREAVQATLDVAFSRPTVVELELSDALFVVRHAPGRRVDLPMTGDGVEVEPSRWPSEAKVKWDNRSPYVETDFEGGGKIVDRYEVLRPDRMLVTRTIEGLPGSDAELSFVYDRGDTP